VECSKTGQVIENAKRKRDTIDISCAFYKMSHFLTNELLGAKSFSILSVGSISPEKFFRFIASLNGGKGDARTAARGLGSSG